MTATLRNIFQDKHVHLVGIKGVAMTSLAQCLSDLNCIVTGSDIAENFVTQKILEENNYKVFISFSPEHITDEIDIVVYTGAHQGSQNTEVLAAKAKGIPSYTHAEALGILMKDKKGMSICGTGGKSTTSAMVSWILEFAGKNPSYSVGVGNIPNLGKTGTYNIQSEWFVAEADEYAVDPTSDHRPRFIFQHPYVVVCPNLSYDHPDIYPTFEKMKDTFASFFLGAKALYVNGDISQITSIISKGQIDKTQVFATVGFLEHNTYRVSLSSTESQIISFTLTHTTTNKHWNGTLRIPGNHNVINAALAVLCASEAGISFETSLEALSQFKGTMRRFEYKGLLNEALQIPCYDDYAHTPDEIKATLAAVKQWHPDRHIILAFQPHTYSRTKALFSEFAQTLASADSLILLDIFASARESEDTSVNSQLLAKEIKKIQPAKNIIVLSTIDELGNYLRNIVLPNSVFITMGAGDIYKVYDTVTVQQ